MKSLLRIAPLVALAACQSIHSTAAPLRSPVATSADKRPPGYEAPEESIEIVATPTIWAAGLEGDLLVPPLAEAELDRELSEFEPTLGVAFDIVHREGEDQHTLRFELLTTDFRDDSRLLESKVEQTMVELALSSPCGGDGDSELFAGLRYWSTENEVRLGAASSKDTSVWIDPILGARTTIELGESVSLLLRGDYGGFGIGADVTWQAQVGLLFGLGESGRVDLGWRHLVVDFDDDGTEIDATLSGPTLGYSKRF